MTDDTIIKDKKFIQENKAYAQYMIDNHMQRKYVKGLIRDEYIEFCHRFRSESDIVFFSNSTFKKEFDTLFSKINTFE